MKTDMKLQVQAYLDGELTGGEAARMAGQIAQDAEAGAIYGQLKDTRALLRETGEQPLRLAETRDFYWSQIRRQIEREETAGASAAARPWWFKLLAPLAGAVALLAVILSILPQRPSTLSSERSLYGPDLPPGALHEDEATSAEVSTMTFRSEAEGITVVWISTE